MLGVPFRPDGVTVLREWQTVQSHAGFDGGIRQRMALLKVRGGMISTTHNVGMYGDWSPFWDWLRHRPAFRAFLPGRR